MAMQFNDELHAEAPPSKRVRLEQPEDLQGATMDFTEENPHTSASLAAIENPHTPLVEFPRNSAAQSPTISMKGIPGLGFLGQAPTAYKRIESQGKSYITYYQKGIG